MNFAKKKKKKNTKHKHLGSHSIQEGAACTESSAPLVEES